MRTALHSLTHFVSAYWGFALFIVIFAGILAFAGWLMVSAVVGSIQYERDRKNPQRVWSRIHGRFVDRFSDDHIGEALFWGNRPNGGSTLGMNGIPD